MTTSHVSTDEAYRLGYDSGYLDAEKVWLDRIAAAPPAPLNVERLARALSADGNDDPALFDLLSEAGRDIWRKRAADIAREYAEREP